MKSNLFVRDGKALVSKIKFDNYPDIRNGASTAQNDALCSADQGGSKRKQTLPRKSYLQFYLLNDVGSHLYSEAHSGQLGKPLISGLMLSLQGGLNKGQGRNCSTCCGLFSRPP